jgi:GNAT superfamily N-acetyltransferase
MDWQRDGLTISNDPARIDRALVHAFLSDSYWAAGIPREIVDRSIENALCFGVYDENRQVGFARVISDFATFAYLADVFVLPSHRGRGLAKWLMEAILGHPKLQGLRRWMLATRDAHGLYRQVGFTELANPERLMELVRSEIYRKPRT